MRAFLQQNRLLIINSVRLVLAVLFIAFLVAKAADEYDMVRGLVRVICSDCLGIG